MTSPDPPRSPLAAKHMNPTSPSSSSSRQQQPSQRPREQRPHPQSQGSGDSRRESEQQEIPAEQQEHDQQHDQQQQQQTQLPPLFTLVKNATSKTTHHPHVHYIFSDDDPDILTHALAAADPTSADADRATRSVLLDLAPDEDGSWKVSHASSLSADWAVVDAGLRKMEDGEAQEGEEGAGPGALMLRVEGVEGETAEYGEGSSPPGGSGVKGEGKEDYGVIIDEFEKRMGVMRRVVDAGESRRISTAAVPTACGQDHGEGDLKDEDERKDEAREHAGNKVGD